MIMENKHTIIHMEAYVVGINGPEIDPRMQYPYEIMMRSDLGRRVKVFADHEQLSKMLRPNTLHSMHLQQAYAQGVNLNQYILIKLL